MLPKIRAETPQNDTGRRGARACRASPSRRRPRHGRVDVEPAKFEKGKRISKKNLVRKELSKKNQDNDGRSKDDRRSKHDQKNDGE